MFERIKALIHRWDDIREVSTLTDRDLDDLGMTREQLEAFVRMPHDINDRVTAMAAIFDVPETVLRRDQDQWLNLLHTCGTCKERGACKHVLERGARSRAKDAEFCLNAGDFAQMARKTA